MYPKAMSAARISLTATAGARHRLPGVFSFRNVSTRQSSSSSKIGGTVVDQTKVGNDPDQEKKDEQVQAGKSAVSGEKADHPAKQADPQKPPERSTGFETKGPDGNAGEGKDTGNVHKEEKPPVTP